MHLGSAPGESILKNHKLEYVPTLTILMSNLEKKQRLQSQCLPIGTVQSMNALPLLCLYRNYLVSKAQELESKSCKNCPCTMITNDSFLGLTARFLDDNDALYHVSSICRTEFKKIKQMHGALVTSQKPSELKFLVSCILPYFLEVRSQYRGSLRVDDMLLFGHQDKSSVESLCKSLDEAFYEPFNSNECKTWIRH